MQSFAEPCPDKVPGKEIERKRWLGGAENRTKGYSVKVEGEGRAKLLLFGEHAVIYGFPAVGLSLADRTRAELHIDGGSEWTFYNAATEDRKTLLELLSHFESFIPGMKKLGRGSIGIVSSIPRNLGYGSSAALCTALSSALYTSSESPVGSTTGSWKAQEILKIWNWSHRGEQLFHGTASGIDTGLSLLNGLYGFTPDPPRLPKYKRLPDFDLFLVVGAVPRRQNTKDLVSNIRARVREGNRDVTGKLKRLGELSKQAIDILESGNCTRVHELAERAQKAHELLNGLGLGSSETDFLLEQGYKTCALGGKMSGAGGGGAFFLFMPDQESALETARKLGYEAEKRGLPTFRTIRAVTSKDCTSGSA